MGEVIAAVRNETNTTVTEVRMSDHPLLDERPAVFNKTRLVIGAWGANFVNALFFPAGTKMLILADPQAGVNGWFDDWLQDYEITGQAVDCWVPPDGPCAREPSTGQRQCPYRVKVDCVLGHFRTLLDRLAIPRKAVLKS